MRNLKRALSLALAAVMVIGMMVVGAGAVSINDFSDADEIVNKDAVSMVTALGIINGLPGGSYGPTQNIDRASFTKMVALSLNGGSEPLLPGGAKVSYVDTANTWASQYIEFCTNIGIVSGDGTTGKFNPTAPVTVSQAAKMLLVALGYNATIEGYVGYDWQMNVDSAANLVGIYNGISGDTSVALTRDNAAQMIYNTLNATMVKYEYVINGVIVSTNQATAKPQVTNTGMKTMLEEKFGVIKVEGVVMGNEFTDGKAMKGKSTIDVTNYGVNDEQNFFSDGTYVVETDKDLLYQNVTMYVKPFSSTSHSTEKATVLGPAVANSNNHVFTTGKTLVNNTAKSNDITKTLRAEGLMFKFSTNAVDVVHNYNVTGSSANGATPFATGVSSLSSLLNSKGVEARYIDNTGDGIIDAVLYLEPAFGKVTVYNTGVKNGTLQITKIGSKGAAVSLDNGILSVADFEDLDLAKNDYVHYYYVPGADLYYIEKAEGTEVDVTAITGGTLLSDRGTTVKAGSVEYTESSLAGNFMDADSNATLAAACSLGESAKFYLDKFDNVIYVTEVDTTVNYLMVKDVTKSGTFDDSVMAKVVLSDGTSSVVTITKYGSKSITTGLTTTDKININEAVTALANGKIDVTSSTSTANGVIYSYTVDTNGNYRVIPQATGRTWTDSSENVALQNVIQNNNPLVGSAAADEKTVFVMSTSGSYALYEGIGKVPTRTNYEAAVGVYTVTRGLTGYADAVFVQGGSGEIDSNNYMYFLGDTPTRTIKDGKTVYTYDVVRKGTITTIDATGNLGLPNGGLYQVTLDGELADSATSVASLIVSRGLAIKADAGVVENPNGRLYYNANTLVFIVSGGVATPSDISAIITDGAQQDTISMIKNNTATTVADYVFIER